MKIYRDSTGAVINIGDWDYCVEIADDGAVIVSNPLPVGAVESDEEVVRGWDDGLYAHDDPRRLKH